jgi:hypothetical protein
LSKLLIEEKSKGLGTPAPAAEDGFSGFEFLLSSERYNWVDQKGEYERP